MLSPPSPLHTTEESNSSSMQAKSTQHSNDLKSFPKNTFSDSEAIKNLKVTQKVFPDDYHGT